MKKLLIGGAALVKLGSDRFTQDVDYLICDPSKDVFSFDKKNNIDYINAGSDNSFFAEIWEMEKGNEGEIASPKALMELKAYSLVMHCRNFHFQKADAAEYDMRFLARTFNLGMESVSIVKNHVGYGEFSEIEKVIKSIRK